MRHSRVLINSVFWAGLLILVCTHNAHAYLDPGTGSYILQLIIAGLLGASLAVKIYWGSIKRFFSNFFSKGKSEEDDSKSGAFGPHEL